MRAEGDGASGEHLRGFGDQRQTAHAAPSDIERQPLEAGDTRITVSGDRGFLYDDLGKVRIRGRSANDEEQADPAWPQRPVVTGLRGACHKRPECARRGGHVAFAGAEPATHDHQSRSAYLVVGTRQLFGSRERGGGHFDVPAQQGDRDLNDDRVEDVEIVSELPPDLAQGTRPRLSLVAAAEVVVLPDLRALQGRQDRRGAVRIPRSGFLEQGQGMVVPVKELKRRNLIGQVKSPCAGSELAKRLQRFAVEGSVPGRFPTRAQCEGDRLRIGARTGALERGLSQLGRVLPFYQSAVRQCRSTP
ncbi:hypothetical protein ACFWJM_18995 [Streptomyces sp. NPDC127077]|uniref:hypothetical protein n=1 Tax=Streptomyces sp. NPDC127077 TaxID=3347131 RepID=UPI00366539A1